MSHFYHRRGSKNKKAFITKAFNVSQKKTGHGLIYVLHPILLLKLHVKTLLKVIAKIIIF